MCLSFEINVVDSFEELTCVWLFDAQTTIYLTLAQPYSLYYFHDYTHVRQQIRYSNNIIKHIVSISK